MAYAANTLVLLASGPNGQLTYSHDAGSDTMATVFTAGYFNNTDDDLNLGFDDVVFSICADGHFSHIVSAVSSGSVTTQTVGDRGPFNGDFSTGASTPTIPHGLNEMGTGTCTSYLTQTPYPGSYLQIYQSGSATGAVVNVSSSGVTFDEKGSTSFVFTTVGGSIELLGVSTTVWTVKSASVMIMS